LTNKGIDMKKTKTIERIKTLINRIENGRYVTRSSLLRVLGEAGLKKLEREWVLELKSRTYKPNEIVEYSKRIRKGLIHYALGEKQSFKGQSYKAKNSIHKAESILENAVEYLRDVVSSDSGLRMWIDRDVSVGSDIEYCPEGIPRPVWSSSNYKSQSSFPRVTKKDIARELLQTKLEKLEGRKPLELLTCGIRPKRSLNISSFSDFKF
jgi:hypothetical protein